MPSSNNKKKSLKDIKSTDKCHPYSRRATQMKRAAHRSSKKLDMLERKDDLKSPKGLLAQKLLWFKYAMDPEKTVLTLNDLRDLVQLYLARHQEDIDKLIELRRPKRPDPPRLALLQSLQVKEKSEYEKAIMEVPNLVHAETVKILSAWEGDLNCMDRIKIVRIGPEQEKLGKLSEDTEMRM